MDQFVEVVKIFLYCGTALMLALLILLALPKSQLRNFLLQVICWSFAALCGVYVVSPIDLIPDFIPVIGWIDDAGASVAGITSAIMAINVNKAK